MGLVSCPFHCRGIELIVGTDATIAEHIAKIIEREYVTEKQEQKIKYLVPSSLGVGLVEGYNAIGFDRSLSKPHLRAEVSLSFSIPIDELTIRLNIECSRSAMVSRPNGTFYIS
jgi:hypothetical protein